MMRSRAREPRTFFPWEARGGLRRWLGVGRLGILVLVVAVLTLVWVVAKREAAHAGMRQTRATLLTVRKAVDSYMADHEGACPPSLARVIEHTEFAGLPVDAWGRPFRLTCPGRRGLAYELKSDGPDGLPEGLDRIE